MEGMENSKVCFISDVSYGLSPSVPPRALTIFLSSTVPAYSSQLQGSRVGQAVPKPL